MSQAKVDKHKEEKKNRAKTLRNQRIKKAALVFVGALGLGAIIGVPLGKVAYKEMKEREAEHRMIESANYGDWFDDYWNQQYGDKFVTSDPYDYSMYTDDELQDMINNLSTESDASTNDAE